MTQGIISIIKNNAVVFKCVTGCNGYKAKETAEKIKSIPFEELTGEKIYQICIETNFGEAGMLVVQSKKESYCDNMMDNLDPIYRNKKKFNDPKFNPRWECGLADQVEIINY